MLGGTISVIKLKNNTEHLKKGMSAIFKANVTIFALGFTKFSFFLLKRKRKLSFTENTHVFVAFTLKFLKGIQKGRKLLTPVHCSIRCINPRTHSSFQSSLRTCSIEFF